MKQKFRMFTLIIIPAIASMLALGCGSGTRGPEAESSTEAATGSQACTSTCHAVTQDLTGNTIASVWADTTHTTVQGVQCVDCHGDASSHWGVNPIQYPAPQAAQCLTCHDGTQAEDKSAFLDTSHGNSNLTPDKTFSQIATAVSTGEHIEECSRCHNPNQGFALDSSGNLLKPLTADLQDPQVSCASCHDAHQPQASTTIPQRAGSVYYPVFRKFFVNESTGAQSNTGTWMAAVIFQSNGAVEADGTLDATNVVGANNELNVDRLCAACHTTGTYKNSGGATHQGDIHTEWADSGHGDRNAAAFAEFSANPPAYTDANGDPYEIGTHRSSYPIDMALSSFSTAGPANTTRNAGRNNFACFKCHNGLGSRAYQDNVEGTSAAPVIFGDSTVTCITCHDAHTDVAGQTKNTRKPVVMTKYTSTEVTFSGNVFLDNTAVPGGTGNETICVFCHQGRESGYTLFKRRLASDGTLSGSFLNEHYLGTGGMLWARNAYEYGGQQYGEVVEHQQTNCNGCHMSAGSRADVGGHTWRIVSEDNAVVNSATCNAAACHDGQVPTTNAAGEFDDFRDTVLDPTNDYDGDGTVEGIAAEISGLCDQLITLLQANGVFYSDITYPYFFSDAGFTTSMSTWSLPELKAAFNLNYVIKGLPSQPTTQVGQPNKSAAVHNFRYNIQILRDSYDDLQANGVAGQTDRSAQPRPLGSRAATNYDPQAGGGYNARQ